eukprot:maker-scaffold64_size435223-snap-gene-3.12 protein:Tk02503 transcript:maker-scaffold64_size435223-snap-gene-3.12-mRNA-1 annotation:"conserved hypothetical protein"
MTCSRTTVPLQLNWKWRLQPFPTRINKAGDVIGKCLTDQFTVSAPGNFAPPQICGFNSGQHMIVDASDECHEIRFDLSGSATRAWDIKGKTSWHHY